MKLEINLLRILFAAFSKRKPMTNHQVSFHRSVEAQYNCHRNGCICCAHSKSLGSHFWVIRENGGFINFWHLDVGPSEWYNDLDEFIKDFTAVYPISGLQAILLAELTNVNENYQ